MAKGKVRHSPFHITLFSVRAYTGMYDFTYTPLIRKPIGQKDYCFPLPST